MLMNILLIGSGGREHALAWKLAQSEKVSKIYVLSGNGGTASTPKCENVEAADALQFAQDNAIDLTVVGPEIPLAEGIVDSFQAAGLRIWGPSQKAAQLEASKAFSKAFMQRHNLPTAEFATFSALPPALEYLHSFARVPVIKASGLAAGKGVIVTEDRQEAETALRDMLTGESFAGAGSEVVIEEKLEGTELSILAFCDGYTAKLMPAVQDHKRALDGDQGLNTGGMGTYTPVSSASEAVMAQAQIILQRTVEAMKADGMPFVGVLFAGFMLTDAPEYGGLKLLEYNCRFGDPETQVLLPLLESDLVDIIEASLAGNLAELSIAWSQQSAVNVVLASGGYPENYEKGKVITGIDDTDALIFHAGTKIADGRLITSGGRVLNVLELGVSVLEARARAYAAVQQIAFEAMHYRNDIAQNT